MSGEEVVHDLQTHSFPAEEKELERCAIRMGYGTEDRVAARKRFSNDHAHCTKMVHDQFLSFFSRPQKPPLFRAALGHTGNPEVCLGTLCQRLFKVSEYQTPSSLLTPWHDFPTRHIWPY
ncbi:MAG: hypothetical protein H8K07_09295 [Nitrospira sp.]|nr:hypothetical protein [Nitrospira sp.]